MAVGSVGSLALGSAAPLPVPVGRLVGNFGLDRQETFVSLLIFAGAVFVLKTLLGVILSRATLLYLARLETVYSMQIARHMFDNDLATFEAQSVSKMEWSIVRSANKCFTGILGNSLSLLADLSLVVVIFSAMAITDPLLALTITAYFAFILALFQILSSRFLAREGANFTRSTVQLSQLFADVKSAFREISVLGKIDVFLGAIGERRLRVARAEAAHFYLAPVPRLIVELGLIIGAIGLAVFQVYNMDSGLDYSTFGIFLVGSLRMMSALLPLQRAFQFMTYEAPLAESAQDYLLRLERESRQQSLTKFQTRPETKLSIESPDGIGLKLESVTLVRGEASNPQTVLEDVSLAVDKGAFVALIGPSGSGKSTLVELALGLNQPTSGRILCDGVTPLVLRSSSPGAIGYVPQKPGLIAGSFLQNIALGVPEQEVNYDSLRSALTAAQLDDLVQSLPAGLATSVGEHAEALSGGELQRIGLARALYTKPQLLILDEATSALDAETESAVANIVTSMKPRCTVVVVAHRLSSVKNADAIHLIVNGQLVASGTLNELRNGNPVVQKYIHLLSVETEED